MILALESSSPGASPAINEYAAQIGLRSLETFEDNPASITAARNLLQELPLDERSFNDKYNDTDEGKGIEFGDFLDCLEKWCLNYRGSRLAENNQESCEALYGFLCLMLITLEALAESDKKRNESRSIVTASPNFHHREHDCRKLCIPLIEDTAVQRAIEAIYATDSSYTVRDRKDGNGDMEDWRGLNFSSLAFHRHGTTSIILRVREKDELRALKLILFPFLRFNAIARETREYGLHYNPKPPDSEGVSKKVPIADFEQPGDVNQSSVVQVLASSERWILMKYIDGLTLAELMSYPELINAKLATLDNSDTKNRTFSELLRERLKCYTAEEISQVGADVTSVKNLRLEALLRIEKELSRKFPGRYVGKTSRRFVVAGRKIVKFVRLRGRKAKNAQTDRPGSVAWHWMLAIGNAIIGAMCDLSNLSMEGHDSAGASQIHGDLTPSNIIVNNSRDLSVTLIDLGRNYFYTQSMAGRGSSDSGFVAPEIREGNNLNALSDVYSVGQLLQYVGYRGLAPREMVFDGFYDRTSLVARFLEDLIQERADQRLTIFSSAKEGASGDLRVNYEELREVHNGEVNAVMVADEDGHGLAGDNPRELMRDIMHPWSRAIGRQLRLYKQQKNRKEQVKEGRLRGYTRWLFWWSTLATFCGALVLASVIFWAFRDLKLPYGAETLVLGQKAITGQDSSIPVVDSWRVASYHVPDWSDNWFARIVGFSYILVGGKYYGGILSGLMPLQGRLKGFAGWHSIAAEGMIRLQTVTAPVLVATTIFIQASFWPMASAIGQVIVFFCNLTVWSFAARSIRDARSKDISTTGAETTPIAGLEAFREWVPSSLFYAVMVLAIGLLIYAGVLHDIAVYAIGVAAINICLFYLIKCGRGGREIRVGLARGCLAAERLRWHQDQGPESDTAAPGAHLVPAQSRPQERQSPEYVGDHVKTDTS